MSVTGRENPIHAAQVDMSGTRLFVWVADCLTTDSDVNTRKLLPPSVHNTIRAVLVSKTLLYYGMERASQESAGIELQCVRN